jgi:cyclic pyranopterin phosphate synthase
VTVELTHVDEEGKVQMVNVSEKPVTTRYAAARGVIRILPSTLEAIINNRIAKGNVLTAAQTAGIMAAKRCDELIPLCHTVPLDEVVVNLHPLQDPPRVEIHAEVTCHSRTGAEMEALLAVSLAALTIYDMVKAIDRKATIGDIRVVEKAGGKSGHIIREEEE